MQWQILHRVLLSLDTQWNLLLTVQRAPMMIGTSITSTDASALFLSLVFSDSFRFFKDLLDGQMGKQIYHYFVLFKHVFEIGITPEIIHRM